MYVYTQSEKGNGSDELPLWTVGFYAPDGKWQPESDHGSIEKAADRVSYLNGNTQAIAELAERADANATLRERVGFVVAELQEKLGMVSWSSERSLSGGATTGKEEL